MHKTAFAALVALAFCTPGLASAAGLTPAQKSEIQARVELAGSLVSRQPFGALDKSRIAGAKIGLMHNLLGLPSSSLRALAADGSIASAQDLAAKARQVKSKPLAKALGDPDQDLVFVPITPCRLADSRNAGGPLVGPIARGYGEEDSALQGGDPGCSAQIVAFPEASAYALNLTALNMNTLSFIAIRPIGASQVTSILNFTGPGQQVNNFVIVENLQNSGNEFEVFVPAGVSVDVIIDVFGLFMPPQATALACANSAANSLGLAAGTGANVTSAACATGFSAVGGNCTQSGDATLTSSAVSGNAWSCGWENTTGSASTVSVSARCCRVPGR